MSLTWELSGLEFPSALMTLTSLLQACLTVYRPCLCLCLCPGTHSLDMDQKAQQGPQHDGKLHLCKLLLNGYEQQVSDLIAWAKLSSACLPACVPLPSCCFKDFPVGKVVKTNLVLAFQSCIYGCSCCLLVLTNTIFN